MLLSGKIAKIKDNTLFIGNPPELTQNPKNTPIEAGPGTLTSDSEFFVHKPRYRSKLTYKRRYIFLDFNRSFLTILGDISKKTANISRLEAMTAIPNVCH